MKKIFGALIFCISLHAQAFNAAFFYGSPFPQELRIYDAVIVEADHFDFAEVPDGLKEKLYAYTSLGEVGPDKAYAGNVPPDAKMAKNPAWASDVMDQTSKAWREFYLEKIIAPLWQRGFRGVFLDTLDSYTLAVVTPELKALQESGMVETLRQMRIRFPGIRIIVNRGFEILPQVHDWVTAVVAESLFQGWDNATHSYVNVTEPNRQWLQSQLKKIKANYHLPVIVIDYVAPKQRLQARELERKIRAAGFSAWVSNPELNMIGVGYPEIQPRRILMLYNGDDTEDVIFSEIHRFAAMPIQYLGFVPEYRDIREALPTYPLTGQYAGIIVWADGRQDLVPELKPWLLDQIDQGMRLAVINEFGFVRSNDNLHPFGMKVKDNIPAGRVEVVSQDTLVGFEHAAQAYPDTFDMIDAGKSSTPILRLKVAGKTTDVAAFMPWGGYVFSPYAIYEIPYQQGTSWIINPFTFFKRALNLPDIPAPDVTTSTGRRLLMAHMDGDGFASNAEFPGSPLAPRVMMEKIFKKYPVPAAVSVIEAETAPWGLYPDKSAEMEQIAREIFLLPNVEIASHSYSHPFKWQKLDEEGDGEGYNMPVPGYKFDLNKETAGSIDYINLRLAPENKKCHIFLWTGDCNPGENAIAKTTALGLLNMNGGETVITNSKPSLTEVSPLGVARDGYFQIFAPNQNENVYTNLWTGPYYGFRRVIETFKLTDAPRRIKPVDIYFHTYSASKPASLKALEDVYEWALNQPNHPVFPSEYIHRVMDFNHSVMAREGDEWIFYGDGSIDTLRISAKFGYPKFNGSVAGYSDFNGERYLHLTEAAGNRISLSAKKDSEPYLADANGELLEWKQLGRQTAMAFNAHTPLDFTLGNAGRCILRDETGRVISAERNSGKYNHYKTNASGRSTFTLGC